MSLPSLSVVMAAPDATRAARSDASDTISDALAYLLRGCANVETEIIVVFAGDATLASAARQQYPGVHFEQVPSGMLTPAMWGVGLRRARGAIVAFTSTGMRVGAHWARDLVQAFAAAPDTIVGVAGPIAIGPVRDAAADALYFLRFSAYLPALWTRAAPVRDIPGDNAAYRRAALLPHADLLREGFWEVEFHRRFERDGLRLLMSPDAVATSEGTPDIRAAVRQRWTHARAFGVARVARHGQSRERIVLAAPLVPFALMVRIGRRVFAGHRDRWRFLRSLPWLAVLTTSWAAGECAGAVGA